MLSPYMYILIACCINYRITKKFCSREETIEDIKLKIEEKEGVPVECQVLPFGNDKMTIREANIRPGRQLSLQFGKIIDM